MRVRLAAWGAAALALAAASFLPAIPPTLHRPVAVLAMLAGFLLLSFDPPLRTRRQFHFLLAGAIVMPVGVLVVSLLPPHAVFRMLAHLSAVAAIALPLWLTARMAERGLFVAGAVLAAANEFTGGTVAVALLYVGYGLVVVAAALCAVRLANPGGTIAPARPPPRLVVGRDVVSLSAQQKAERIAALDRRLAAGEIPEHIYWDRRQEIESR